MNLKLVIRYSLIWFLVFSGAGYMYAQDQNTISSVALVKENSVMLRWAPGSVPVWQTGRKYGYIITRYTIARNGTFIPDGLSKGIRLTDSPVKPFEAEYFDTLSISDPRASVIQEALYGKDFDQVNPSNDFGSFMKFHQELEIKMGFALFICDLSTALSKAAGLFYEDTTVVSGERYAYSITPANIPEGLEVEPSVVVADAGLITTLPVIIDVQSVFIDRAVKFRWPVSIYKGIYSAYILEKSENGKDFFSVSELPLVSLSESENPDYFSYSDSLSRNNKLTWYRIKGITPFGEKGPPSETIKGEGIPDFSSYASIDTARVVDGKITIRWRLTESSQSPVKEIYILRCGKYNGLYETLNRRPLSNRDNFYTDNSPAASNYYQLLLIGNNSQKSYSFPYFIQTEDSEPPDAPEKLAGKVDSSGIVTIIWEKNIEPDLLGYKVFRANSPGEDFISLAQEISANNLWHDTINLNTLTQKIYYQVIAVDKNYNSSEYSEILELSRPDTIRPAPALISKIEATDGKVVLQFEKSPGNDIGRYELYRQAEDDSTLFRMNAWQESLPEVYQDSPALKGKTYHYSLITSDISGNSSENGRYVFIPSSTTQQINPEAEQSADGSVIKIHWNYPDGFYPGKTLIYRSAGNDPVALYTTIDGTGGQFEDNEIELSTTYCYRIVVYSLDGKEAVTSGNLKVGPSLK
jgi:hypothetical protein